MLLTKGDSLLNFAHFYKVCAGHVIDIHGDAAKRLYDINNLGGPILIEHISEGKYHLKSDGLFTAGLTYFHISNQANAHIEYSILDESTIEINVFREDGGPRLNNYLYAVFQITVWNSEDLRQLHFNTFGCK
jgi:hypothetical protein